MKVRLGQDARDFLTFVTLYLNLAVLHCAAGAAGALHCFGQLFFLRQADADKVFDHRYRLAATPGLHPENVHPPAILLRRFDRRRLTRIHRWIFRTRRKSFAGQGGEGSLT